MCVCVCVSVHKHFLIIYQSINISLQCLEGTSLGKISKRLIKDVVWEIIRRENLNCIHRLKYIFCPCSLQLSVNYKGISLRFF